MTDEQVEACPECDATDFQIRRPGNPSSNLPADAPRFRCYDCGHAFDDPVERPGERVGLVGAAKVLDELDADDVATDGGVPSERSDENSRADRSENPYVKSGIVTADEEVWVQDRIKTAIRMGIAVTDEQRVHAEDRQVEDAIDGIANGTAVAILDTLNLQTEGTNLRLRHNRDAHLKTDEEDADDVATDGGVYSPDPDAESVTVRHDECEICHGTRDVRPAVLKPVDEPLNLAVCAHCRQFYGVDADGSDGVACFACDADLSGGERTVHMFEIEHPLAENIPAYSTTSGGLCGDCATRLAWKMYQDRWPGHNTGGGA